MKVFLALCPLFALGLVGSWRIILYLGRLNEKATFATEFFEQFKKYLQSHGQDMKTYGWLVHRSTRMQEEMGGTGIVANYHPPYAQYMYPQYPIILNIIPELNRQYLSGIHRLSPFDDMINQLAAIVQDALIRYQGVLSDRYDSERKKLKNPFQWLSVGAQSILSLPIAVISWVGLVASPRAEQWSANVLIRIAGGIVALLTIAATVVTILSGWDGTIGVVHRFLK